MAAKKSNPAMDFIVDSLKQDRAAQYKDIAAAAAKKKITIYPIMFGRAQALLGIVKSAKRGEGKAARLKAGLPAVAGAAPAKRGPGRPRKVVAAAASPTSFDGSIAGIVASVKSSEHARARYMTALTRIQAILAEALA